MRHSVNNIPSFCLLLAALVMASFLTACATADPCRSACRLNIELPSEDGKPLPPKIDKDAYRVAANTPVEFTIGGASDAARTLLVFEQPAFLDPAGKAVYVLKVIPGQGNEYRTVQYGTCSPPRGCKYTIVNFGTPERPPLDPWIIIDR
jgi:hypothetical protein